MSLLDDVSIVVTPNGYKAGELYAVIPSNGDADMDVTRSTAATRVDENGLVNYAEIIGSEEVTNGDFSGGSTGWTLSGAWSLGTNKVIFSDTSNGDIRTSSAIFTATKTYQIKLTVADLTGSNTAFFGMGDGSASNLVGYDNYANGDYTFTVIAPNGSGFRIYSTTSSGSSYSITNISIKEVTRDNVPRIDYTGGGCPHILAEPQRTNLVTYSEVYGSGTFFSGTSGSVIDNTTSISPSGDANATQVTSTGAGKIQSGGLGLTINTDYTLSFYAKNVDATAVTSRVLATGGSGGSNLTSVSYISELSTTEWTKITHSFNTGTNTTIYVYISNVLNSGGTIQLWGAQLEEGSYATSYIPNFGTLLGVTRNQDIFTRDGIGSLINSTEGVLFLEMAALQTTNTNAEYLVISDGTYTANSIMVQLRNGANQLAVWGYSGSVYQIAEIITLTDITDFNKIAIKWKVNDFEVFVNGSSVYSLGTYTAPTGLDRIEFSRNGSAHFFGKVKQLQVYTTALSPTQLAALTS